MPILTAYFGVSVVNVMLYYSDSWYEFVNIPYTYSENLFSSYVDEADFNKAILETILKTRKEKLSDFQILVSGYLTEPRISIKTKVSTTIPVLLNSLQGINPIFTNVFGVTLRDKVISYADFNIETGIETSVPTSEGVKFFTDLALYPNLCPVDLSIRTHIDQNISDLLDGYPHIMYSDFPLAFTGDRFSQTTLDLESDYILMLSLVRELGVYDLKIDKNNAIVHSQLLRSYDQRLRLNLDDILENVGTLISSNGYTECLFEKEIGSKQLFEVETNRVFIMPFKHNYTGTVSIKNHVLGNMEKPIMGGKIGLIVDTREEKGSLAKEIRLLNSSMKQLDVALRGL